MDNAITPSSVICLHQLRFREESWGTLGQRSHTLVRDLIALPEIQRGELGAPGQHDHTLSVICLHQ